MMSDRYFDPPEDDPTEEELAEMEAFEPDFEAMVTRDGPTEDQDCNYWNRVT